MHSQMLCTQLPSRRRRQQHGRHEFNLNGELQIKSNNYSKHIHAHKMSQSYRPKNDRHHDVPSSEPNVELATLTLPSYHRGDGGAGGSYTTSSRPRKAVVLHASKDTTSAFATDAERPVAEVRPGVTGTVSSPCVQIQAVVDLEKLSHLAHATDDEFVLGLHREANDHTFNPRDSKSNLRLELEKYDEEEKQQQQQQRQQQDEEALPLLSTSIRSAPVSMGGPMAERDSVPLEIRPFTNAVMETEHCDNELGMEDILDIDACTFATEDNVEVQVGHDAFLLELPPKSGGKVGEADSQHHHHFVLALPEVLPSLAATPGQHDGNEEAEHHKFPILERAMTIMSTHLPSDIRDVQLKATAVPVDAVTSELYLDLVIQRQVPLIGYLILFFGFFALASAGAAFDLQGDEVTASMKTYWRLTSTALLMFPIVVTNVRRDGLPNLTKTEWLLLVSASFCYAQMTTVFVVSLALTSLANAFVFSNMTSLVIIVAKSLMGVPVLMLEASGAIIGIVGGIICSKDQAEDEGGDSLYPNEMLGNLIALSASFGTAAYLAIARDLRSKCDLFVFMFTIFFLSSFFVLAFMMLSGEPVEFSRHPNLGMFGWMNLEANRLPLELFFAVVVNGIGTLGYIAVLKFFDSIVVSVIMLMEPVVGVFIGVLVGVDTLPGTITWVGDTIVTLGSALVVYSGAKKTESIDATKAVRPRSDTIAEKQQGANVGRGRPRSKSRACSVEMLNTPVGLKRPSPEKRREQQQ